MLSPLVPHPAEDSGEAEETVLCVTAVTHNTADLTAHEDTTSPHSRSEGVEDNKDDCKENSGNNGGSVATGRQVSLSYPDS